MIVKKYICFILICFLFACKKDNKAAIKNNVEQNTASHPSLILTQKGVKNIKAQLGTIPLFDKTLEDVKQDVDAEISKGIAVPIPKDFSGGYTHEQHKKNFLILQKAGVLYQILDDEKYAVYVRDMFLEYAKLYPTLPLHPQERSYARGKLFWQCLNDSNWLVYASQAYDCIYNWLSKEEREHLENDLFIPFANFISEKNPQFFNRVHNHSTWGNVAVGMIALVMDNDELLQKALYGLKTDSIAANLKDDDGGFIKNKDQKVGFLANLDEPFSPDGYYTEGPYYQRYAMYPFLIFAQALENKKPELKIFEHKNAVLTKAVEALINLTDKDGEFYTINDAQKGMSYYSRELVTAVDIAYHYGGNNPELLSIAKKQNKVNLDDTGLAVALGLKNNLDKPFRKKSITLTDGPNGNQGGISILRNNNLEVIFKYTAQGLSHGHYDKLSFFMYNNGTEVIQDYGLARFVNIEQKGGGNYLKENTTWAKQTIAHNTVIQNETSHFNGKYSIGSKNHSNQYLFNISEKIKVVSAKENNAYPGTELHRTMAIVTDSSFIKQPFVLDIFNVIGTSTNKYDLPFYYKGQIMQTNFKYTQQATLKTLGDKNGYQHLFVEALADAPNSNLKFNWMHNNVFYTLTSATQATDKIIFARIGANDPEYNLRRDPTLIIRKTNTKNALYVNAIEAHGSYSPVSEFSVNAYSSIAKIETLLNTKDYTAIRITNNNKQSKLFIFSNTNPDKTTAHSITINDNEFNWVGSYTYN
ncbi:Heparinase II/III family protein [Cellulophaga lytica DSM 7489]|uniref:Heparinase II/III family protein n=1 Tax=Cellulophaga lytica (strain ATCC 23178 / DSM 7489 / JCM 8516 / NBRC 14961 / NCIMB 1423 / VKM B-1433 / Cy l20) TaxID=867900 RepID=F0RHM1_CELLC|nr:alginate lyase family protein [Cellulophaga lytica]ADY28130.1 Heparinase II/III family protein [Cellulophaga lytica DSM 7489]AXF38165.1 oligoalginate lyase [Cellulophaga sp.]WQG77685.1 alginate lyase family protein [Cellulophaga lytica]